MNASEIIAIRYEGRVAKKGGHVERFSFITATDSVTKKAAYIPFEMLPDQMADLWAMLGRICAGDKYVDPIVMRQPGMSGPPMPEPQDAEIPE